MDDKYVVETHLSGTSIKPYGVVELVPITQYNIYSLKPGNWIWDDKLVERREHKRSLWPETTTEPIGFRQIHILDLKDFGTIFNNQPFMLSDIDGRNPGPRWVHFEEDRFYMLRRKD